jgi:hypothetical protein
MNYQGKEDNNMPESFTEFMKKKAAGAQVGDPILPQPPAPTFGEKPDSSDETFTQFMALKRKKQREDAAGVQILPSRKDLGIPDIEGPLAKPLNTLRNILFPYPEEGLRFGDISEGIAASLPGIGGAIPLMAAPAIGPGVLAASVAGSVAGSAVQNKWQRDYPELAGKVGSFQMFDGPTGNPIVDTAIEDIGINLATVGTAKLWKGGWASAKQSLANKLVGEPGSFSPEAAQAYFDLSRWGYKQPNISAGIRGGPAELIENLFATTDKQRLVAKVDQVLIENLETATGVKFHALPTTEDLGDLAYFKQFKRWQDIRGKENLAFMNFRQNAPKESVQIVTGYKDIPVSKEVDKFGNPTAEARKVPVISKAILDGPIYYNETQKIASGIKTMISKRLGEAIEGIDKDTAIQATRRRISALDDIVDTYGTGIETINVDGKIVPTNIIEFDQIQMDRNTINTMVPFAREHNLEQGQLKRLAMAMNRDIKASVSKWRGGPGHAYRLEESNALTKKRKKLFNKDFYLAMTGEVDVLITNALKSKKKARKYLESTGDTEELSAEFLANFIQKFKKFDDKSWVFDAKSALQEWDHRKWPGLTEVILKGNTKKAIKQNLRFFAEIPKEMSMSGNTALTIAAGRVALRVATGTLSLVAGSVAAIGAVQTGGVMIGLSFAVRDYAKRVLMNPKIAKIATRLYKSPVRGAGSTQTKRDTMALLAAMKGTRAVIYQSNNAGERTEIATVIIPQNVSKNLMSNINDPERNSRDLLKYPGGSVTTIHGDEM